MNQKKKLSNSFDGGQIDLVAFGRYLWEERKFILKTLVVFLFVGIFVAIFSEKKFSSSTTFVTQSSENEIGGNLGGLAAMAGINFGNLSSSEISADLYPQILSSVPFQKEMLNLPLSFKNQENKLTFKDYYSNVYRPSVLGYMKKYTVGLPNLIIGIIKGDGRSDENVKSNEYNDLLSVTYDENELIKRLENQLEIDVNDAEGYITLRAYMPEALASAELAVGAKKILQDYIIDFKIKKAQDELIYVQERYNEVELKLKKLQNELALEIDSNRNLNSTIAKNRLNNIQSEYDLVYSLFIDLAKRLEMQHLKVKEDTPIFTVIKPVVIPNEKDSPKRFSILLISLFLGLAFGIIIKVVKSLFFEK